MAGVGVGVKEIQRIVNVADCYVTAEGLDPEAATLRAEAEALPVSTQLAIRRAADAHAAR